MINLMVKAFIEHFQKPATRKQKAAKYKKSNKHRRVELPVLHPDAQEGAWEDRVEFVIDEGNISNSISNAEDKSPTKWVEEGLDENKTMHDACVIKETTAEAIKYAYKTRKLLISDSMQVLAQGVLIKPEGYTIPQHFKQSLRA
ncbi:hypothetical protein FRC07_001578 [Ceratobasidium sp. 392]|nr:hypothetical protein FRC07_001578 [Ceratobasidium sp. 392]